MDEPQLVSVLTLPPPLVKVPPEWQLLAPPWARMLFVTLRLP